MTLPPLPASIDRALSPLKDFQLRTVDYVFRRMYLDNPAADKFLIADEVGLGKTLVARGIAARVIRHLHDEGIEGIDVIYVCSNGAIAHQNINRLNVTEDREAARPTRLTLLPTQLKGLKSRHINFVSFTPGTTFDLRSRGGIVEERALIFRILQQQLSVRKTGFLNVLQCTAGKDNWRRTARQKGSEIDTELAAAFTEAVLATEGLLEDLDDACNRFAWFRKHIPAEDNQLRYQVIGRLRYLLANICIAALEPNLVILDEFQRFKDLLDGQTEAAELAQALFRYPDVRVLLLSATPYRMLTLDHETDDDHYPDFIRTLGFLLADEEVPKLEENLRQFRNRLYLAGTSAESLDSLQEIRRRLQRQLLQVMVRTERVSRTEQRDAMLTEPPAKTFLREDDLEEARFLDAVARIVGAQDPIEYWKSSPYLLNFMKDYKFKEKLEQLQEEPPEELLQTLRRHEPRLLKEGDLADYGHLQPPNPRLRHLLGQVIESGLWKLLWLPPCLPYFEPSGPYRDIEGVTKTLIFSAWNVVPDALSTVLSYEAERRMVQGLEDRPEYKDLYDRTSQRLRFQVHRTLGRFTGMNALVLMYPCAALAELIDPLLLSSQLAEGRGPASLESVRSEARRVIRNALRKANVPVGAFHGSSRADSEWYWSSLASLDAEYAPDSRNWCLRSDGWQAVPSMFEPTGREGEGQGFIEHVKNFASKFDGDGPDLFAPPTPEDLPDVLVDIALGSPAVCALRALRRVAPGVSFEDPSLRTAAAAIAEGFRTLFNMPPTMGLLDSLGDGLPYWRRILKYGIAGNLQSVLDEYVHSLRESLGLVDHQDEDVVKEIAAAVDEALSIRTTRLSVDELRVDPGSRRIDLPRFGMRCRFALRFGEMKDESGKVLARIGLVRQAFNSPFRPFVLATTSIGQEGLDFHTYCHVVYHWNLPSNPVDLEQREGRVHRFKGHAIRKNVATRFGLEAFRDGIPGGDPWEHLFNLAKMGRNPKDDDLVPYWIYEIENGATVERRVPVLPLSRDAAQLRRLKRSLAVYRLAFGQPRQEDLLAYLEKVLEEEDADVDLDRWRISLSPPSTGD